jgi:hypothetical protein
MYSSGGHDGTGTGTNGSYQGIGYGSNTGYAIPMATVIANDVNTQDQGNGYGDGEPKAEGNFACFPIVIDEALESYDCQSPVLACTKASGHRDSAW